MIKHLLSFLVALFALSLPAAAQDLEGTWAMQIDDAAIFVFSLEQDEDGSWRGTWLRPARFQGNGVIFSQLRGSEEVVTTNAAMEGEVLVMRFAPTRPEGSVDVLQFRLTGEYQAEMTYMETGLEPYPLVRVAAGTELGPFSDDRIYDRDNAVSLGDYDPAAEVETEVAASEPRADEFETIEDTAAQSADDEGEGISENFLDGLDDPALPTNEAPEAAVPAASSALARACADLDRDRLPTGAELDDIWGDDFDSIGTGLEIREYRMANGDIARITFLGESIYVNSCGPA